MKVCDDCFEEYSGEICPECTPVNISYTSERCIYIWQVYHARGCFDTEEQLKEYANVKKAYKKLTDKNLPVLNEKIKGGKR